MAHFIRKGIIKSVETGMKDIDNYNDITEETYERNLVIRSTLVGKMSPFVHTTLCIKLHQICLHSITILIQD